MSSAHTSDFHPHWVSNSLNTVIKSTVLTFLPLEIFPVLSWLDSLYVWSAMIKILTLFCHAICTCIKTVPEMLSTVRSYPDSIQILTISHIKSLGCPYPSLYNGCCKPHDLIGLEEFAIKVYRVTHKWRHESQKNDLRTSKRGKNKLSATLLICGFNHSINLLLKQ